MRLVRAFLFWLAAPFARFVNRELREQDYGYVVLKLPRVRPQEMPAEYSAHRVVSMLEMGAPNADIVAGIDKMRSVMNSERLVIGSAGEFVLACCDCGGAHRLRYQPAIHAESNQLVLDVIVGNDAALAKAVRVRYDFPFQKITVYKPKRIFGGN